MKFKTDFLYILFSFILLSIISFLTAFFNLLTGFFSDVGGLSMFPVYLIFFVIYLIFFIIYLIFLNKKKRRFSKGVFFSIIFGFVITLLAIQLVEVKTLNELFRLKYLLLLGNYLFMSLIKFIYEGFFDETLKKTNKWKIFGFSFLFYSFTFIVTLIAVSLSAIIYTAWP